MFLTSSSYLSPVAVYTDTARCRYPTVVPTWAVVLCAEKPPGVRSPGNLDPRTTEKCLYAPWIIHSCKPHQSLTRPPGGLAQHMRDLVPHVRS